MLSDYNPYCVNAVVFVTEAEIREIYSTAMSLSNDAALIPVIIDMFGLDPKFNMMICGTSIVVCDHDVNPLQRAPTDMAYASWLDGNHSIH